MMSGSTLPDTAALRYERRVRVCAFGLAFVAALVCAEPLDDAIAALERKDYPAAVALLAPLAEARQHVRAGQPRLSDVRRRRHRGQRCGRLRSGIDCAAEQGDENAQYNLGVMYENGKGVDRDLERSGEVVAQGRAAGIRRRAVQPRRVVLQRARRGERLRSGIPVEESRCRRHRDDRSATSRARRPRRHRRGDVAGAARASAGAHRFVPGVGFRGLRMTALDEFVTALAESLEREHLRQADARQRSARRPAAGVRAPRRNPRRAAHQHFAAPREQGRHREPSRCAMRPTRSGGLLESSFGNAHLFTTLADVELLTNKKGEARLTTTQADVRRTARDGSRPTEALRARSGSGAVPARARHRQRRGQGQERQSRQVPAAAEPARRSSTTSPAKSRLSERPSLRVVDMGCGKGYLTFALYDYCNNRLGVPTEVIGVDRNPELMKICAGMAAETRFRAIALRMCRRRRRRNDGADRRAGRAARLRHRHRRRDLSRHRGRCLDHHDRAVLPEGTAPAIQGAAGRTAAVQARHVQGPLLADAHRRDARSADGVAGISHAHQRVHLGRPHAPQRDDRRVLDASLHERERSATKWWP